MHLSEAQYDMLNGFEMIFKNSEKDRLCISMPFMQIFLNDWMYLHQLINIDLVNTDGE